MAIYFQGMQSFSKGFGQKNNEKKEKAFHKILLDNGTYYLLGENVYVHPEYGALVRTSWRSIKEIRKGPKESVPTIFTMDCGLNEVEAPKELQKLTGDKYLIFCKDYKGLLDEQLQSLRGRSKGPKLTKSNNKDGK